MSRIPAPHFQKPDAGPPEDAPPQFVGTLDDSPARRGELDSYSETAPDSGEPHRVERLVQQHLLSCPDASFSSLVIRRVPNGICLQGVLEADSDIPDVDSLARQVAGVNQVINRLVVRRGLPPCQDLPVDSVGDPAVAG